MDLVSSIASWCVSGVSVNLLLKSRMIIQGIEGLLLNLIVSSSCYYLVCCLCRISSFISLFSVCIQVMISCVGVGV